MHIADCIELFLQSNAQQEKIELEAAWTPQLEQAMEPPIRSSKKKPKKSVRAGGPGSGPRKGGGNRELEPITGPGKANRGSSADDMCEACGRNAATRECGHGILCPKCDKDVHGKVNGPCEL